MKYIPSLLLAIIAIMLILLVFPKSCETKLDTDISSLKIKSDRSSLIDSLQKVHEVKLNHKSDSLVSIYSDSISKIQTKLELTAKNYNALRVIVKDMRKVKADSSSQVVNGVPVVEYNASIEQGDVCDEYLSQKNAELNMKDSIISTRDIQLEDCNKSNTTCETALTDSKYLSEEKDKKLKKSHWWNKVLVKVVIVETAIIAVAVLILK